MSLINKMLRDLDARQASNVDRSALPGTLHPLPPEPASSWPKLAGAALVVAALGAWWLTMGKAPPAAAPVIVAEPPPPRPAPVPEAPPLVAVVTPKAEVPASAPPKAEPRQKAEAKPKTEAPKPRSEAKLPVERAMAETSAMAAPPPAKPVATTADTTPAAIDKRPRTAPANEAAEAEYRKGMTALRRGATSEAVMALRTALNLEKKHASVRQALLSVFVEQQQWNEAQALVEEGLALDPAQTGWAMVLARLQFEHGKLAEAAETLARHAAHAEQHSDYQAFHALLLQKQKRHAEAVQRYRAALALRPTEARWWYGLGLALEADQKTQEARAAFLQAREAGNLPPELLPAVDQRLR